MSYKNFSEGYKETLVNAENNIKKIGLKDLRIEDIFIETIRNLSWATKDIFDLYWIDSKIVLEIINKWVFNEKPEKRKWVYSWMNNELKNIILMSVKTAASFKKAHASTEDFLLALIQNSTWFPNFLDYIGIVSNDIETNLVEINKAGIIDWKMNNIRATKNEINQLLWSLTGNIFDPKTAIIKEDNTPFAWNKNSKNEENVESDTPVLDFFSEDLTSLARENKLEKVIGRENEITRLIAILNRKTKNNPVLIWEPWVGKTAVAEWLARAIVDSRVPFSMKNKKILSLDLGAIVAWTKYRWDFEQRIKQIIEEASKVENEIILFIDEIHTIIWAWSGEGGLDVSNILKPAMWRWKIRIIWATTQVEYKKYIEKDSALERRFQKIEVSEPDKKTAIQIISWLKEVFEEYHNLNISDKAVNESVNLSMRYITDRFLPDKAIDLIDEACSLKSMNYNFDETKTKKLKEELSSMNRLVEEAVISSDFKKASKLKERIKEMKEEISQIRGKFKIPKKDRLEIKEDDIQKVLSIMTWIPVSNLDTKELNKLKSLHKTLKTKIIGQDEAIENIVKSIMRNKSWIWNKNRPLWSFLFLWPTWVGKTELVKALAQEFYSDKDALIKFDMSEYSDKTSVNKLIGSSAWYIGYEDWWLLTEKVKKKPYSIVLFDEIEKWDFDVFNLLLQVLEDWVLTDNKWRKISFKNTILIMTSNIWAEEFNEKAQLIWFDISDTKEEKILKDFSKAKENIISNLSNFFSPEFINRVDKITVFSPLDKVSIKKIVKIQIEDLEKRLDEKQMTLKYDSKVLNNITKQVYNPEFWAREIRRFITDHIEDNIAEKIINSPNKKSFEIYIEKNELKIK